MASALNGAIALTRAWVRLYTRGLPDAVASARREEIECDLWEMQHDPELRPRLLIAAVTRGLSGIAADLAWRTEHAPLAQQLLMRRVAALAASAIVVVSLWGAPVLLFKGRREVASCAATAATPTTTAALRHDVIRCAGAFFSKHSAPQAPEAP